MDNSRAGDFLPGIMFLKPSQQTQKSVKDCKRMGRTAGDIEIDGQDPVGAVMDLGMVPVGAARDGARSDGNHDLGSRDRVVGLA